MTEIDKSRLIAAVAARLKIRLDENDPAFVLVELNRLILDQTVRDVLEKVRDIESRLTTSPGRDPQAAEKFAALIADRLAKDVSPKATAPPGAQRKEAAVHTAPNFTSAAASAWAVALACALFLAPGAFWIGYRLGLAHASLP